MGLDRYGDLPGLHLWTTLRRAGIDVDNAETCAALSAGTMMIAPDTVIIAGLERIAVPFTVGCPVDPPSAGVHGDLPSHPRLATAAESHRLAVNCDVP